MKKKKEHQAWVFLKSLIPKGMAIEMHKKSCFWKSFATQPVNVSLKLLESVENHNWSTFLSFWTKLSLKKSFLVRFENLGLLVNRLTAMTSILVIIERIYCYHFKCNYLKHQRHFAAFYCIFRICIKFTTFKKKKLNLIA